MTLLIDTSEAGEIKVEIKKEKETVAEERVEAKGRQSEELLVLISRLLQKADLDLSGITRIQVVATGDSFTGLRIGVATANALGYGLGVPVQGVDARGREKKNVTAKKKSFYVVSPEYDKPPNITLKK